MLKKHFEIKILSAMFIYLLALTIVDFTCIASEPDLYTGLLVSGVMLVLTISAFFIKKPEGKKAILYSAVLFYSFISIPVLFFIAGETEGYRILFFVPTITLLSVVFSGKLRINLLCAAIITYLLCVMICTYMPDILPMTITEVKLSAQMWTFIITVCWVIYFTYIFFPTCILQEKKTVPETKQNSMKIRDVSDLKSFVDADSEKQYVIVCFSIDNDCALKKEMGTLRYDNILREVRDFLYSFSDEETLAGEYGGNRFLLIMQNNDEEFVHDFAQSIVMSVNDKVCLKYSVKMKMPAEDFTTTLEVADRKL